MKKKLILGLFLIGAMFLVAGCGNVELKVGDTLENDDYDITITRAEVSKYVDSTTDFDKYLLPVEKEEKYFYANGNRYENAHYPDDGKVMVSFTAELSYKGKKEYEGGLTNKFKLEYSDGYEYEIESVSMYIDGSWELLDGTSINHQTVKLETLNTTPYTIRGYFMVPEEVMEKEDEPLKIHVQGFGKTGIFTVR